MTPPQSAASPCRPDAPAPGLLLLLALLSFAVYGRTLSYELVSDDGPLLRHVEERYRAGGLAGLLASPFEVPSGLPGVSVSLGYYRPVVMASLWLDSRVAPALPQVFHLTNVLLHAGVTVVVFLLGAHLLRSRRAALWCSALFAVHPVHTESVASVAGRTDLWAALFVLLSTLAWLRVRSGASRRPSAERAWGALAFALGSLSKEVAFALPLALSAWDAPLLGSREAWRGWWERNRSWFAAWGVSLAALAVLRWGVAGVPLGSREGSGVGAGTTVGIVIHYARLLLFPVGLNAYYTADQMVPTAGAALSAALLLGVCLAAGTRASGRIGVFALLWMGAFLAPVTGIVPLVGAVAAERFLYLPSLGLVLVAAGLLDRMGEVARFRRLAPAAMLALTGLLAAASFQRLPVWRDNLALFSSLARSSPRTWISHYGLGTSLAASGRHAEAIDSYLAALRLKPDLLAAHNNLGVSYRALGRHAEAVAAFTRAVEIGPDSPGPYENLGLSLAALGRFGDALAALRDGVRTAPRDPKARHALGLAEAAFGSREGALEQYRALIPLDPDLAADLLRRMNP